MEKTTGKKQFLYLKVGTAVIRLYFHYSEFHYEDVINQIKKLYKGFVAKRNFAKEDFTIHFFHINQIDIFSSNNNETYSFIYRKKDTKNIYTHYQINTYQFQYILRRVLLEISSRKKMVIVHASASKINGKAYVFIGSSGAGKSTTIKLLKQKYEALADDSIIIAKENDGFYFYQTPYYEKELWIKRNNSRLELGGIFFLIKSRQFLIDKIEKKETILANLLQQITTTPELEKKHTKIAIKLLSEYNYFYYLYFDKKRKQLMKLFEEGKAKIK